jgi:predicted nucleic acid-binding protein
VIALDSSVAIPALHAGMPNHNAARAYLVGKPSLPEHAALEVYSALTRMPEPVRVAPRAAVEVIADSFAGRILSSPPRRSLMAWLERMADARIAGGAVYDAWIAETARIAGASLVTNDRRAAETYRVVGVEVELMSA